jgi:hypothetical protein
MRQKLLKKLEPGDLVQRRKQDLKKRRQVGLYIRKTPPSDKSVTNDIDGFIDVLSEGKIVTWWLSNLEICNEAV